MSVLERRDTEIYKEKEGQRERAKRFRGKRREEGRKEGCR
jgi:hypothetical protein